MYFPNGSSNANDWFLKPTIKCINFQLTSVSKEKNSQKLFFPTSPTIYCNSFGTYSLQESKKKIWISERIIFMGFFSSMFFFSTSFFCVTNLKYNFPFPLPTSQHGHADDIVHMVASFNQMVLFQPTQFPCIDFMSSSLPWKSVLQFDSLSIPCLNIYWKMKVKNRIFYRIFFLHLLERKKKTQE